MVCLETGNIFKEWKKQSNLSKEKLLYTQCLLCIY